MENKRTKGITILGWGLIITSITGIISNLYLLFFNPQAIKNVSAQIFNGDLTFLNNISSVTSLILSIISIFLSNFFLTYRRKCDLSNLVNLKSFVA